LDLPKAKKLHEPKAKKLTLRSFWLLAFVSLSRMDLFFSLVL
jgi:hypothetical protein